MIILLAIVVLSIAAWTTVILRKKGENHQQIKEMLKEGLSNAQRLAGNLGSLIVLLVKDTLKNKHIETPEEVTKSNPIANDLSSPDAVISESDYASTIASISEKDDDEAISGFSPEVINIIREEEEKAA